MTIETCPKESHGRVLAWPACVVALACAVLPMAAVANTVLSEQNVFKLLDAAVTHYYQKNVRRQTVESACYFDPQVGRSMACAWRYGGGGVDSYSLRQRVRRDASRGCRNGGGSSCALLWRNGKLRLDSLSPEVLTKVESIARNLPNYDVEAVPLPAGIDLHRTLLARFGKLRDRWEKGARRLEGYTPHYALCTTDGGPWSMFSNWSSGSAAEGLKIVREMCMLKCQAAAEWFQWIVPGKSCYLVFENGKFASEAAAKAVMR